MPPTFRWPFRLTNPASVASATNLASRSASPVRKVTFMPEREPFSAWHLNSLELSRVSYSMLARCHLRCSMA